jgi:hypothetical protein
MDNEEIKRINEERLESWKAVLTKINSTPVLIIALDHTNNTFGILTTEDLTPEQIKKVLQVCFNNL